MKKRFENESETPRLAVPVTEHDHIQGPFDAPLTLVEYGDFECPYCGSAYETVKAVQQSLGNRLRFVFRHFPLTQMHPHAEQAAEASEAAGEQGHFWEMHDMLFENQDAMELENIAEYGMELNLDVNRMLAELENGDVHFHVMHDVRSGMQSQVNGTPTFFVNGLMYDGPDDAESLVAALTETAAVPH